MYIAIGILLTVAVLLGLLLLVPVRIRLSFSHTGGKSEGSVHAGLGILQFNLTKFLKKKTAGSPVEKAKEKPPDKKAEMPQTEKRESKEEPEEDGETSKKEKLSFRDIENALSKGVEVLRYLRKKFTVKLFCLRVRMGLGDAADTGIATGAGYAAIYSILGSIDRYFILKKHEVVITPVFRGVGLEMEFRGEFQLRLVYCLGLINKIRKGDAK